MIHEILFNLWVERGGASLATRRSQRSIKLISLAKDNVKYLGFQQMFQSHLVDELEKRVFGVAISICCVESLHDAAQHNGVHLPAGNRQSAQHTQHEPSLKMNKLI